MQHKSLANKALLTTMALLGWFAIIAQFYININSGLAPITELIIRFFSYFTVTTNFIVAICCTTLLIAPNSKLGAFFSKQGTFAAITVYILIVGIIYNVILRFLWVPTGLQKLVDELLHSVIPILYLVYWLLFLVKNQLQWKSILSWLIYPLSYLFWALARGAASGFYPYPFINVIQLGLQKVLINSIGITLCFVGLSSLLVLLGKSSSRKSS